MIFWKRISMIYRSLIISKRIKIGHLYTLRLSD
nr:MAG TPA: hypothetical protein [Caudoviricetes sp.]